MNAIKMMQQLREVKKMQKQLAKKVVEMSSPDGMVTVRASADMTVKLIKLNIDDPAKVRFDNLGRVIASTVNSAFDSCKRAAAEDMSKFTDGMGLGGILGGK